MKLPYAPRPGQPELVEAIEAAHAGFGHLVAEAGTGTGKTICALSGSLGEAPVLYATRTNSQQEQVLEEHRRLRAAGEPVGIAIPFMGRRHYCPLLKDDERFKEGTPEELGRLCRDAKQKALQAHTTGKAVPGACSYYGGLLRDGTGPVEALLETDTTNPSELAVRVAAAGSCPYEALKLLLPQASLVIVPTIFIIDEHLRMAMLDWMGASPDQIRLVVDEAHHLPEAIRGHHSPRLGLGTIDRAIKEAEEIGDPILFQRTLATELLVTLHALIRDLALEYAPEADDGWLPHDETNEALMVRMGIPGPALERIAAELDDWGEHIREKRRLAGRLPRSYLGAVSSFLRFWLAPREAPYVHLVLREPRPALEAYLLDPAAKSRFLGDFASTIHMSGTLSPVGDYAQRIGLPNAAQLVQPSPFDPEALRSYTVRHLRRPGFGAAEDALVVANQQTAARALLAGWSGRIGVFFPSHRMLHDYMEAGFLHGVDADIFQEEPGMPHASLQRLLGRFRDSLANQTLLLGVLGGRLTEGVDYPGDCMEKMIVLGVPYPKPSARSQALIHHFDARGENGWRVAVHDPTGRTLRQAIGRLIRGPDDQGTAVILDERAMRFKDHLPRLRMVEGVGACIDNPPPQQEGFHSALDL